MKKAWCLLLAVVMCLSFAACAGEEVPADGGMTVEIQTIDNAEAESMVAKIEAPIVDVIKNGGGNAEALTESFRKEYGAEWQEVMQALFGKDYNESADLELYENSLFATLSHEGVKVTDAYIERIYTKPDKAFVESHMCIVLGYEGDNSAMKDFEREIWFMGDESDNWQFNRFEKTMGVVASPDSLPIK